jgi:hypothetical protein
MLNGMGFEPGDVVTASWCARVHSWHAGHVSNLRCSGVRTPRARRRGLKGMSWCLRPQPRRTLRPCVPEDRQCHAPAAPPASSRRDLLARMQGLHLAAMGAKGLEAMSQADLSSPYHLCSAHTRRFLDEAELGRRHGTSPPTQTTVAQPPPSLLTHPEKTPVRQPWPAKPQATDDWRRGGPPATSPPPATAEGSIAPTTSTNRSRAIPNPSLGHSPAETLRQSPPARSPWPPGTTLQGLNSS